jgi:hypothetical protein
MPLAPYSYLFIALSGSLSGHTHAKTLRLSPDKSPPTKACTSDTLETSKFIDALLQTLQNGTTLEVTSGCKHSISTAEALFKSISSKSPR